MHAEGEGCGIVGAQDAGCTHPVHDRERRVGVRQAAGENLQRQVGDKDGEPEHDASTDEGQAGWRRRDRRCGSLLRRFLQRTVVQGEVDGMGSGRPAPLQDVDAQAVCSTETAAAAGLWREAWRAADGARNRNRRCGALFGGKLQAAQGGGVQAQRARPAPAHSCRRPRPGAWPTALRRQWRAGSAAGARAVPRPRPAPGRRAAAAGRSRRSSARAAYVASAAAAARSRRRRGARRAVR